MYANFINKYFFRIALNYEFSWLKIKIYSSVAVTHTDIYILNDLTIENSEKSY